jgi:hypothetical protein
VTDPPPDTVGDPLGGGADYGTDNSIVLQITRNDFIDILNFAFPDTSQADQEEGHANVYQLTKIPVGGSFDYPIPEDRSEWVLPATTHGGQ